MALKHISLVDAALTFGVVITPFILCMMCVLTAATIYILKHRRKLRQQNTVGAAIGGHASTDTSMPGSTIV